MRTSPEITLPLQLSSGPIPAQLIDQLRELIAAGVLRPGDAVPSSRALAAHLRLARGTVVAAYDQLLAEGYLSASTGRSTIVNPHLRRLQPRPLPVAIEAPRAPAPTLDLRPGLPWVADLVDAAWRSAWRRASVAALDEDVPSFGLPDLRAAWADHLRRMRGVVRSSDQIAVTGGGREGLGLLLQALRSREFTTSSPLAASAPPHPTHQHGGHFSTQTGPNRPLCEGVRGATEGGDASAARLAARVLRVGVEEPGYPSLRRVPAHYGAQIVPLPTDAHGLITDDLPTGDAAPNLILVTPSHQYPLGGSLPVDRRQALLEWARQNRVIVVEDDYDSELRYTSQPLPALASLDDPADPRVVMLGTLSKTLTPALAMGFLALPEWLVPAVREVRQALGQPVGVVPQRALANYLVDGALRLHTQRMRQRYRRRRTLVVKALSGVPGVAVYPMDGGLHAVVETRRAEAEVVSALAADGVRVSPLSEYWSGSAGRQGIVFGFGSVGDADLARGLALIAAAAAT